MSDKLKLSIAVAVVIAAVVFVGVSAFKSLKPASQTTDEKQKLYEQAVKQKQSIAAHGMSMNQGRRP